MPLDLLYQYNKNTTDLETHIKFEKMVVEAISKGTIDKYAVRWVPLKSFYYWYIGYMDGNNAIKSFRLYKKILMRIGFYFWEEMAESYKFLDLPAGWGKFVVRKLKRRFKRARGKMFDEKKGVFVNKTVLALDSFFRTYNMFLEHRKSGFNRMYNTNYHSSFSRGYKEAKGYRKLINIIEEKIKNKYIKDFEALEES
jgi:hypothetical protein